MGMSEGMDEGRAKLAEALRELRDRHRLSMSELGERTGLVKSTISDAENPRHPGTPTPATLLTLATFYGRNHDEAMRLHLEWMHLAGYLVGVPSDSADAVASGFAQRLSQLPPRARGEADVIVDAVLRLAEQGARTTSSSIPDEVRRRYARDERAGELEAPASSNEDSRRDHQAM